MDSMAGKSRGIWASVVCFTWQHDALSLELIMTSGANYICS